MTLEQVLNVGAAVPLSGAPEGETVEKTRENVAHLPVFGSEGATKVQPATFAPDFRGGMFRWVVFQVTRKGRFRLTRWLRADTKSEAEQRAAERYEGCAGTLEVVSAIELSVIVDDQRACARTRIAPIPEGARRPNVKRGTSYGECAYCGRVTTADGGRPPKYCDVHRNKKDQRAFRMGQFSLLAQLVPGQAVRA